MSQARFSFVLPVRLRPDSLPTDLGSVVSVTAKSVAVFFPSELIDQFFVVACAADLQAIKQRASFELPDFPFRFIDEVALCPIFGRPDDGHEGRGWQGWHKQQVIKIAAASIVQSPYYITLDDDVILTRQVQLGDLVDGDRLAGSYLPPSFHESWYRSCCEVLKCSPDVVLSAGYVMGVTPQVVVTEIMRNLQDELARLWNIEDFAECLLELAGIKIPITRSASVNRLYYRVTGRRAVRRGISADVVAKCRRWTEHQLYWTYLQKEQIGERYYSVNGRAMTAQGVWSNDEASAISIDEWIHSQFDESHDHFFTVFASQIRRDHRSKLNERVSARLADACR